MSASRRGLRSLLSVAWLGLVLFVATRVEPGALGSHDAADEYYDSHFHLTNYIQQGIGIHDFLGIMGRRVGRSVLFGIPLQQEWSYANSGDFAPTYYLQSDARPSTTTPSPTLLPRASIDRCPKRTRRASTR